MPRVCHFTGKKTSFGKQITHRGKAKYLGGVGTKITGLSNRKFKPNIQTVRAVVDGQVRQVDVALGAAADQRLAAVDPPCADDLAAAGLARDQPKGDRLGHLTSRGRR